MAFWLGAAQKRGGHNLCSSDKSGVKYYNFDGEEQDVFMTLAEAGVNYIRLRVWNDPYDENGNGYGGGNNDVATAIELGKRATKYGMKLCIDFHYSDFWADPKRQHAPKAWQGMTTVEKDAVVTLLKSGSKAVREISESYEQDIQIVVHYTKINQPNNVYSLVEKLVEDELDFDGHPLASLNVFKYLKYGTTLP